MSEVLSGCAVRAAIQQETTARSRNIMAALVKSILEKWGSYEWTVQGFGMIRTKIYDIGRIHIWDSRCAVNHVSTMHAHPWPLKSKIISGELINHRFEVVDWPPGLPYWQSKIATGEGGHLIGDATQVVIMPRPPEMYSSGDVYEQAPEEIHRSIPQDGTVTLIQRPMGPPLEETFVYWPYGTKWVSAEPMKAPTSLVKDVVEYALERWNP